MVSRAFLMAMAVVVTVTIFSCGSVQSAPYVRNLRWWRNPDSKYHVPIFQDGYTNFTKGASQQENLDKCRFYVFTRFNAIRGQELIAGDMGSITRSNFIRGAPVKVLAHGFLSRMETDYPWLQRQAYLALGQDVNIILVDWQWLANGPLYDLAAANTKPVGQKTAVFLAFLLAENLVTIDQIHMAGMSLGSHVSGAAGAELYRLTGQKLPRITGNDPAGPLFELAAPEDRLDPTDAHFVDVVHTDAEIVGFGITFACGHVDFWPNGGKSQPGAITDAGDHARAVYLNEESITSTVRFKACKCTSWNDYVNNNCDGCAVSADMGEPCSTSAVHGNYYLRTNSAKPFAQG